MNYQAEFLTEVEREIDFLKSNLTALEKSRLTVSKVNFKPKGSRTIKHRNIYGVACSHLSNRHKSLIKKLNPAIRANCSSMSKCIIFQPYDYTQIGFGSYSTCLSFYLTYFSVVTKQLLEYIKDESTFFPDLTGGGVGLYFRDARFSDTVHNIDYGSSEVVGVVETKEVVEDTGFVVLEDLDRRVGRMLER